MKHLYKAVALFLLFGVSVFLFRKMIPEASVGTSSATELQTATFPIMYLQLGNDYTINTLHGYSSELNSSSVRDSITPLSSDKSFYIKLKENKLKIVRRIGGIENDKY